MNVSNPRATRQWTRREWLARSALSGIAVAQLPGLLVDPRSKYNAPLPSEWSTLAQHAVETAKRAGAQYADAHVTHTVNHLYGFVKLSRVVETIGIGVRALVNGYWGFSTYPSWDPATAEQLGQDAVAQAKVNARGTPRTVDLGSIPAAVGHWTMPVRIDPFTVPIEEKLGFMRFWMSYAKQCGVEIDGFRSFLCFQRQERVVATSEGSHFTQTVYETGGKITVVTDNGKIPLLGLTPAGKGWELFLDTKIPEQLRGAKERIAAEAAASAAPKPANVGRYTLVCDGATMAAVLAATIGRATQLDRALGYEANASGTSFLNDPIAMLGTFKVASPLVTVTGNRTAPGQLATVRWDDEGVDAQSFTLVNKGILDDFQTTREQAAWLAPYYQRVGRPVRSHGCAASEDAGFITMQRMPNLALTANTAAVDLQSLVADVKDGILLTEADTGVDFQSRSGLLGDGKMYEIKNGRVERPLVGGAIMYDTLDFWKHVTALGGSVTQRVIAATQLPLPAFFTDPSVSKGQPPQSVSYSVQGVAATITQQALVNPMRKA